MYYGCRYVHYFKVMIEGRKTFYDRPMFLESVIIRGVPNCDGHGVCRPLLRLFSFPMGTTQAELIFEWPTDFPNATKTEWSGKHEGEVRSKCRVHGCCVLCAWASWRWG